MDFDNDGRIKEWEWNHKNLTRLVEMLNESISLNPSDKVRFSKQTWLDHRGDKVLESIQDRYVVITNIPYYTFFELRGQHQKTQP